VDLLKKDAIFLYILQESSTFVADLCRDGGIGRHEGLWKRPKKTLNPQHVIVSVLLKCAGDWAHAPAGVITQFCTTLSKSIG